jgi:hypothetical protein
VEVQIQQFKVGNCPPESGEVGPVDALVVLVYLRQDEIKVTAYRLRAVTCIPDRFKFLQEQNFVVVFLGAINAGEPPV